ncbi:MAG: BlaI/MecI/CopY family transcriptional regulator [Gemmataceae bacterium]
MDDVRTPTPRELAILKVLWEHGPCSVKDVHRILMSEERDKDLAYNTVQTMLRLMEDPRKALVEHSVDGRTFIYAAKYSRDESARSFLDRVFDGAASDLMLSLLQTDDIAPAELDRMETLITQARRKRPRKGGEA